MSKKLSKAEKLLRNVERLDKPESAEREPERAEERSEPGTEIIAITEKPEAA